MLNYQGVILCLQLPKLSVSMMTLVPWVQRNLIWFCRYGMVLIARSILDGYFNPLVFWYQWEYLLTSKDFCFAGYLRLAMIVDIARLIVNHWCPIGWRRRRIKYDWWRSLEKPRAINLLSLWNPSRVGSGRCQGQAANSSLYVEPTLAIALRADPRRTCEIFPAGWVPSIHPVPVCVEPQGFSRCDSGCLLPWGQPPQCSFRLPASTRFERTDTRQLRINWCDLFDRFGWAMVGAEMWTMQCVPPWQAACQRVSNSWRGFRVCAKRLAWKAGKLVSIDS